MRRTLLAAALVLFMADLSYGQTCQAFINGAKARMSKNKWADAREVLAEQLGNCQGEAEFHYLYAIALARVSPDSSGKAVQHLSTADSLNGDPGAEDELQANIDQAVVALWGPIVNEGVRLLQAGELDEAQRKLELAVQINPQGKEAQLALGAVYQGRNDFDRAIELYRKALEIDPAYKLAYLRLGQTYQLKAEAYAASSDSAQVAQAEAVAAEAIEIYEDYLEENPDDADAQVQLAGADQHLLVDRPVLSGQRVAGDIDIGKPVQRAQRLQLVQSRCQGARVQQPDVLQRSRIGVDFSRRDHRDRPLARIARARSRARAPRPRCVAGA